MLQVRNLRVEKGGRTVCHVAELQARAGENVALIGPNGCGKSTLLRVLGGLEHDVQGTCDVHSPPSHRVYLHQTPYLFRGTVDWNVEYGLAARGVRRENRTKAATRWLRAFGIGHLSGRSCSKLSGGEARRVALARAFAVEAKLVLLDEPFAELDPQGIDAVCVAIAEATTSTFLIANPTPLPPSIDAREHQLAALT